MSKAHRWRPIELPSDLAALASPKIPPLIERWRKERKRLAESGALERLTERIARRWSIETGNVERACHVPADIAAILVERGFLAGLIPPGRTSPAPDELVPILNDHRSALNLVREVIEGTRELGTGWIKELHATITRHQGTCTVVTPQRRRVDVPLQHGAFKALPNDLTRPDGFHEYGPPEHVASEMERLMQLYSKLPDEFPEVRAAWLHHAFTQIHPFQDGNGRVARALASIDFLRAELFPLLVDRQDLATSYIPALESADEGDLRPLMRYFATCQERALVLVMSEAEAAARAGDEQPAARGTTREQMAARVGRFQREVETRLNSIAARVPNRFGGLHARVTASIPSTAHRYRVELIDFAKAHAYLVDLQGGPPWVRLHLEGGGMSDLVVTLHFMAHPTPGALVVGLFIVHQVEQVDRTPPGDLWTVQEVASYLKVSKDWVYRHAAAGDLRSIKVGSHLRFPRGEVKDWLQKPAVETVGTRAPVIPAGVKPLLFMPSEAEDRQSSRLAHWLDESMEDALPWWTRNPPHAP